MGRMTKRHSRGCRGVSSALPGAGIAVIALLGAAVGLSLGASKGPHPAPVERTDLLDAFLAGPMAGVEEIVFAVRALGGDGHWYANFGYHSSNPDRMQYGPDGGRLCRLNLRTGKVTVILDDPGGGVRDPCVHYDGRKILFSYRRGGSRYYHLHEIGADGTGLRQLTDGPYDDIEPIYRPDGRIIFCSSRCNRWVQCWFTHVAILYVCDADGRNLRPLSSNAEQDNTPWMLPDGRVLYMRWEYVDRSRVQFHHLWTMNPDGTAQMVYYGNMYGGIVMLDSKPIPGTDRVVSIFSPGHGQKEHAGRVTIVDPNGGPDARPFAVPVSAGSDFRDPYPFSEDCFLVARGRSLLAMNGRGEVQVLYTLGNEDRPYEVHEPRPLGPRPREPVVPPRVDLAKETGRLALVDVTHGRSMEGVARGEVRKLLVLETLPKPVNHSGTMEPISLGGTFTLPRILGTVPVEPDGSAYLEVPALRSLFFVALDAKDLSVKRMQSFLTVQPGELTGCVGCHENRADTARLVADPAVMALRRAPSRIEPIAGVPDVFDFPRDIQPILDKHCLKCHDYDKRSGGVIFSGDRGPIYSHAYATILSRGLVTHGQDAGGNRPPRSIGSASSRLIKKIGGTRDGDKLSPHEATMVRLWIESGVPYAGTYASLGTGMVGVSLDADVEKRRCEGCHAKGPPAPVELQFNLSRPEKSLVLLAPLAKESGGYGLCTGPVFADTRDPDYRKVLASVAAAKRRLDEVKRFDMAGFQPSPHYVREMKRFGILPAELDPAQDRVNVYATDQAYWRSLWWKPQGPEN